MVLSTSINSKKSGEEEEQEIRWQPGHGESSSYCVDFGKLLASFKQGADMNRSTFLEDYSVRIHYIAYVELERTIRRLLK